MSIVLPFIEREREQVLRLLDFLRQLNSGKPLRRTLYLVPFKGLKIEDVLEAARAAFSAVEVIRDHEGAVSDWKKGDKMRDAAGPNSLFRQAAWHFFLSKPPAGAWLWLEPDCVPLVAGWDETIEAAYRASGKPFLGASMKFSNGNEYLNGVAVYPRDAVTRAPALVTRTMWTNFPDLEIAFDVAGGADVLRQASLTDLIAFEPRDGAALVHGDRDGKILEKLLSGDNAEYGRNVSDPGHVEPAAQPPLLSANEGHVSTVGKAQSSLQSPSQKTRKKKQRGEAVSRLPHKQKIAGSIPAAATPVNGNGHFETVGDQIRGLCDDIFSLIDGHANRKTRLVKEIRKRRLLPLR